MVAHDKLLTVSNDRKTAQAALGGICRELKQGCGWG